MNITIPYGKEIIDLVIPKENILDIVQGNDSFSGMDEKEVVLSALKEPIKSATLSEIARQKTSVRILASDITRPCPSYKFLPQLIDELISGGVEFKNIKVVTNKWLTYGTKISKHA